MAARSTGPAFSRRSYRINGGLFSQELQMPQKKVYRRILIVEDDPFVAFSQKSILQAEGWTVIGPALNLRDAVDAAAGTAFDCAFLDVNLKGEFVTPVVDLLTDRGIPFTLVTAYSREALPKGLRRTKDIITKPFSADRLRSVATDMLLRKHGG